MPKRAVDAFMETFEFRYEQFLLTKERARHLRKPISFFFYTCPTVTTPFKVGNPAAATPVPDTSGYPTREVQKRPRRVKAPSM